MKTICCSVVKPHKRLKQLRWVRRHQPGHDREEPIEVDVAHLLGVFHLPDHLHRQQSNFVCQNLLNKLFVRVSLR